MDGCCNPDQDQRSLETQASQCSKKKRNGGRRTHQRHTKDYTEARRELKGLDTPIKSDHEHSLDDEALQESARKRRAATIAKVRHSLAQVPESMLGDRDRLCKRHRRLDSSFSSPDMKTLVNSASSKHGIPLTAAKDVLQDTKEVAPMVIALKTKSFAADIFTTESQEQAPNRHNHDFQDAADQTVVPNATLVELTQRERSPSKDSFKTCVDVDDQQASIVRKQDLDVQLQKLQLYQTLTEIINEMRPYSAIGTDLYPRMLNLYKYSLQLQTDPDLMDQFDECGRSVSCWLALVSKLQRHASDLGFSGSANIDRAAGMGLNKTLDEHLHARQARSHLDAWRDELFGQSSCTPDLSRLSEDLAILFYGLVAPEHFDYEYIWQGLKAYNRALLSWYGVEGR